MTETATPIDTSRRAKVSRILPFSCVDGTGNRLVIFLQGCNYSCINCHNPHTINHCNHCGICVQHCPDGALSVNQQGQVSWDESLCSQCDKCIEVCSYQSSPKGHDYSVSDLLAIIRDNQLFISGITVSGGEATLELPFVTTLFKAVKADPALAHLTCFVDSNGSLSEQGWQRLLPYLDGAMIDLKAWQSETHLWLTGRDNHRVFSSLQYLADNDCLHEVRLLLIPGKTDLAEEVDALGSYLRRLPDSVLLRINAFGHHGVRNEALLWDKCTEQDVQQFQLRLEANTAKRILTPTVYL
jgi:YjjW family glycine radical enzyme activase